MQTPTIGKAKKCAKAGDYERAVAEYTHAIDLYPRHLKAICGRGLAPSAYGKR